MPRSLLIVLAFAVCTVSAAIAQNDLQYFYHSGKCNADQKFWNLIVINAGGVPVRSFGVNCNGEMNCSFESDGTISSDGKLVTRKIEINPDALGSVVQQDGVQLTSATDATAWFINAESQKPYSTYHLNKGEPTAIDMSVWPQGIYIMFVEHDGQLTGFRQLEHF